MTQCLDIDKMMHNQDDFKDLSSVCLSGKDFMADLYTLKAWSYLQCNLIARPSTL